LARETRAYRYLSDSVASFYTAEDLAALMRDAGFTDVSFRRKSLGAVAIHVGTRPA
jgi:demethylmenaquinone methyltransferase/2-methoxy-6-polyprenyl-1,4-benzoquinol methylase